MQQLTSTTMENIFGKKGRDKNLNDQNYDGDGESILKFTLTGLNDLTLLN